MKQTHTHSSILKKGLLSILVLLANLNLHAQTTRYVKTAASGTSNGSSWANASNDLQAIINASAAGDAVWIAAGTYLPTRDPFGSNSPANPRDKTFFVKNGVKIYGGFVGTETALSQRNITTNITTLSGDIGTASDNTDNCYHVVLAVAPTSGGVGVTIDGFTITKGNANGGTVNTISGNSINRNDGAGIYIMKGTNTISNNRIYGNNAERGGAGIMSQSSHTLIDHNSVYGNVAVGILTDFESGGGISSFYDTNIALTNNLIYNNSTEVVGGGASIFYSSVSNLINNVFSSNVSAGAVGGGIYCVTNDVTPGTVSIRNNTFYGNQNLGQPGGPINIINNSDISSIEIKNCIFQNNTDITGAADIDNGFTTIDVTYCLTQAGSTYSSGTGIINNQDPKFLNPADVDGADNIPFTIDDGFMLESTSPCVNTGTSTGAPTTDIVGTTRGSSVEMGAYEYQAPLSVELLLFKGQNTEEGNLLIWQTTNEINNKGFEIERKQADTWQKLGFVAAKSKTSRYEFVDNSPLSTSYYRLKQLDNDGTFDYSKVIVIQKENKGVVKIYPSITKGQLTIEGAMSFDIVNTIGQVVLSVGKVQTSNFNIQSLTNGIYLIRGLDTEGGHFLEKIVKQ